jgi:hypothetical protein
VKDKSIERSNIVDQLVDGLLDRNSITEHEFDITKHRYPYIQMAFKGIDYRTFNSGGKYLPGDREKTFLKQLMMYGIEKGGKQFTERLSATKHIVLLENVPLGDCGFVIYETKTLVLSFPGRVPDINEDNIGWVSGFLVHEAAHIYGEATKAKLKRPGTDMETGLYTDKGIFSEIYSRQVSIEWAEASGNMPQIWLNEAKFMVDLILSGIITSGMGQKVQPKDVSSESQNIWNYYWANGVDKGTATRLITASQGLVAYDKKVDPEDIAYESQFLERTTELNNGNEINGYWITFNVRGQPVRVFTGINNKGRVEVPWGANIP